MHENLQDRDQKIIDENTAYVLGMYDLYHSNREIISALKRKGIDKSLIPYILHSVKMPAYEKRIRQGKRRVKTGIWLFLLLTGAYLFFANLPGAETVLEKNTRGMDMLILLFKFYRELFFLVCIFSIVQIISGILSIRQYTKLLQKRVD